VSIHFTPGLLPSDNARSTRPEGRIMSWLFVVIAGLVETGMAVALKESHGFSRLAWSFTFVGLAIISFGLLSLGLKTLPVGTAYAVWTGIGVAGTAIIGMIFLGESKEIGRLIALGMIIAGVAALKFLDH
jgi:quaternary ammonium compound-resistance protein SugE